MSAILLQFLWRFFPPEFFSYTTKTAFDILHNTGKFWDCLFWLVLVTLAAVEFNMQFSWSCWNTGIGWWLWDTVIIGLDLDKIFILENQKVLHWLVVHHRHISLLLTLKDPFISETFWGTTKKYENKNSTQFFHFVRDWDVKG